MKIGVSLLLRIPSSSVHICRPFGVLGLIRNYSQPPLQESENIRKRRMEIQKLKIREEPVVLKLNTPEFRAIFTDELHTLIDLFKKYNYEIRVAGGPVRDLLMNKIPVDMDFATTATPTQMKEMFSREGVRMINANGEKHGTITPRINDKVNYEVTTLRIDVRTDGRHAEVEFTKDWLLDANRRDLTINSMFLDFEGAVYDYFFGYEDLKDRKVRFVGDSEKRIKEDYLRILRYFRFYGRIAERPDGHESVTLQTIRENAAGLKQISGERIWMELKKILQGNYAGELVEEMMKCEIFQHIGLPPIANLVEFKRLWKAKSDFPEPYHIMTILSSLLNTSEDALKLHERLKFSAYERDMLFYIVANREEMREVNDLMPFQQMCIHNVAGKPSDQKEYVEELAKALGKADIWRRLSAWEIPKFPLNGHILKDHGCPPGKAIGKVMTKLKYIWALNEFRSTEEELLQHLSPLLSELEKDGKPKKKVKVQ